MAELTPDEVAAGESAADALNMPESEAESPDVGHARNDFARTTLRHPAVSSTCPRVLVAMRLRRILARWAS
jgi:hypothetical protein